jgi:hypothetical protein
MKYGHAFKYSSVSKETADSVKKCACSPKFDYRKYVISHICARPYILCVAPLFIFPAKTEPPSMVLRVSVELCI